MPLDAAAQGVQHQHLGPIRPLAAAPPTWIPAIWATSTAARRTSRRVLRLVRRLGFWPRMERPGCAANMPAGARPDARLIKIDAFCGRGGVGCAHGRVSGSETTQRIVRAMLDIYAGHETVLAVNVPKRPRRMADGPHTF